MDLRPRPRVHAQSTKESDHDTRDSGIEYAVHVDTDRESKGESVTEFRRRESASYLFLASMFLAGFLIGIFPLDNTHRKAKTIDRFRVITESHDGIVYRVDPLPPRPNTSNLPQTPVVDRVPPPLAPPRRSPLLPPAKPPLCSYRHCCRACNRPRASQVPPRRHIAKAAAAARRRRARRRTSSPSSMSMADGPPAGAPAATAAHMLLPLLQRRSGCCLIAHVPAAAFKLLLLLLLSSCCCCC